MATARRWAAASIAVVVLGLATLLGQQLYSHAFYRSPWQVVPSKISACGRDYINPSTSGPQTQAAATKTVGNPIRMVGKTSGWFRTRQIWGHRFAGAENAGTRCGVLVYLRADSKHFIEYALSGGP
jgi:hypothetical protein